MAHVQKWGNSPAVRAPKALAGQAELRAGLSIFERIEND
jgi:antitoxin component of MazEF toxin-antitoxin module